MVADHPECRGRIILFEASYVYDPFPNFMHWLESLAEGRFARISMNIEDVFVDFHTFPADDSLVRFLVLEDERAVGGEEAVKLDVLIARRSLIRSFYEPFIRFWEGPELAEAWEQNWECDPRNIPEEEWDVP